MKNSIVRIEKIELTNFKNVGNGTIEFEKDIRKNKELNLKSEIRGIYGQNGSGKTAIVEACSFLKTILDGEALPNDTYNYINVFERTANLKFDFFIEKSKEKYLVNYEFVLEKLEDKKVRITKEKLTYSKEQEGEWTAKVPLIEYDVNYEEEVFTPKNKFNKIISADKENIVKLKVEKTLAIEKNISFIFNDRVRNIFENSKSLDELVNIIDILKYFARCNLFVITNDHTGIINMKILMPFSFRLEQERRIDSGDIAVKLASVSIIDEEVFNILSKIIKQMNVVLKYLVPNLEIELYNYGKQYDEKGNIGVKVELLSIKKDKKLPIQYESEGIKKIISILSALISMYNNPSISMIVDELDSGIYEFLLGEILKVIEQGGKGQLIFTSHNLRPLEVLNKDSLYFTTTNSENRYIKFTNVKPNNNLRSLYIRSINLGGQQEELYNETSGIDIQRAFRLAGDKYSAI